MQLNGIVEFIKELDTLKRSVFFDPNFHDT